MKYKLNNIAICTFSKHDTLKKIENLLNLNKSFLVVTFNLDFLRISKINQKFKTVCYDADFVVPDGIGITTLLNIKYGIKVKRITGNDLLLYLLSLSDTYHLKYAFIGSSEETQKQMRLKISKQFPKLQDYFFESPPIFFENNEPQNTSLQSRLQKFKPDILLVALGCPRQEIWLNENMKSIGAKINIGVGASFDFYAGNVKRAPVFFQRLGLEWLWRLIVEPKRLFNRYIIKDVPFYFTNILQIVNARLRKDNN